MGSTTSVHGLRYPAGGDAPQIPTDFLNLASDVDAQLPVVSDTEPTKKNGLVWYAPTAKTLKISDGAAWYDASQPAARHQSGTVAVVFSSIAEHTVAITFPVPFATVPHVVCSATMNNGGGQDYVCGVVDGSTTTTGCTLGVRFANSSAGSGTATLTWIALAGA